MQPICNQPFPELQTPRLLLRRLLESDAEEVYFLRSDDAVMRFLGKDKEASVESARLFIGKINEGIEKNETLLWGIALAEAPSTVIGTICLWQFVPEHDRCEIGYVLHPGYWGKGIMKEAAKAVTSYAFDVLQLHSIEAQIHPGNLASAQLLLSLGYKKEGYFRENFLYAGVYYDTEVYRRLATD